MTSTDNQAIPNSGQRFEIKEEQLPVHCPAPGSSLWNSHPQVYLPVKENGGHAKCPYCGTEYLLKQ